MADYQEDKKRADAVNDFVVRNMTSDPQATANGINAITQSVTSPPNPQWGVGAGSDLKKVLRATSYIPRRTWGAARNIEQDIAAPAQFAAAAALNYLSGGEAQSLVDSTAKNLEERAKRYGIGVDSAPVKTVAAPVVKSEPAPLAAPPVKRPEFTSQEALNASVAAPAAGASGNRNDILYAAINRLDDKQFEKFMKDHPDIPGLSFIKGDDGRVVRSAENPDRKRNEPMTNAQLVATAAGLTAAGHLQQGIGARENAAATKQAAADYRQEALWEKSNKSVQDLIGILGKDPNTEQVDPQLAYYKMKRDSIALPATMSKEDRKSVETAMEAAYVPVRQMVSDFESSLAAAGKPRKATNKEIFAISKAYEKSRGWSF